MSRLEEILVSVGVGWALCALVVWLAGCSAPGVELVEAHGSGGATVVVDGIPIGLEVTEALVEGHRCTYVEVSLGGVPYAAGAVPPPGSDEGCPLDPFRRGGERWRPGGGRVDDSGVGGGDSGAAPPAAADPDPVTEPLPSPDATREPNPEPVEGVDAPPSGW